MLRRLVPVAASAAAIALVSTPAFAAPATPPVSNQMGKSFQGSAEVILPDARHVRAWLIESTGERHTNVEGWLSLEVWSTYACSWSDACETPHSYGYVELTDEQIRFDRGLWTASVQAVDVVVNDSAYGYDPIPGDPGDPAMAPTPGSGMGTAAGPTRARGRATGPTQATVRCPRPTTSTSPSRRRPFV